MSLLDHSLDPALRRRRIRAADVQRMLECGVLTADDRCELLHGELIEMAPRGEEHVTAGSGLANWLSRRLPEHLRVTAHSPLRLSKDHEPAPDIYIHPEGMNPNRVRGADTLLVVEVSDSGVRTDRLLKAPVYAAEGVRLYWIVDLERRTTWVHTLKVDGYGDPQAVPFDRPLASPEIDEPLIIARFFE